MLDNAVIITGVNGGIGEALARCFKQNGYFVIGTDIHKKCSESNVMYCPFYICADLEQTVIDIEYSNNIFNQIKEILVKKNLMLKGLVNNAAVQLLMPCQNLNLTDWQKTLNVNLLAPFFWTQSLLPELENAYGSVVNISSIHAKLTKKEFVAYATSKAALSSLTRNMAVDLGNKIRVNAIEPAAIDTKMLNAGFKDKKELFQQLNTCHPAGRIGKVDEVAELTLAIIDGKIAFLNGAVIGLDGGIGSVLHDPDN